MDKLPNKMSLVLGDWSGDGHGKTSKVLVATNKTVQEIQDAYKASCKLTGVEFNHNEDYTERKRNYVERRKFQISVDYESGIKITSEVNKALAKHGMKIPKYILDEDFNDSEQEFTKLWFDFVKLSLPDLKYKIIEDNIPCINGHYDINLNVQFGYGIYSGG